MKAGRLLSALIAASALISLAACGSKDPVNTGSVDANDLSVKQEIKIGMWDSAKWGNDDIAKYIEEKLNIEIIPVALSTVDYIEKLNISAAAELPTCSCILHSGYTRPQQMDRRR